jgi:23S rRNA (uracil1939-C5)-methyltransferase
MHIQQAMVELMKNRTSLIIAHRLSTIRDADVIVVDPPRAGLAEDVVAQLSEQPARAIAYVSCDPATLARDLARFEQIGSFAPTSVVPHDLFPQTFHVETVCLLSR